MVFVSSRIVYAVLFYILLIVLIIVSKPSMMFDEYGDIKQFGIGDEKTMFSLGVFSVILAVISFYIFCLVDMIFAK